MATNLQCELSRTNDSLIEAYKQKIIILEQLNDVQNKRIKILLETVEEYKKITDTIIDNVIEIRHH
jgi:hypothetical protein